MNGAEHVVAALPRSEAHHHRAAGDLGKSHSHQRHDGRRGPPPRQHVLKQCETAGLAAGGRQNRGVFPLDLPPSDGPGPGDHDRLPFPRRERGPGNRAGIATACVWTLVVLRHERRAWIGNVPRETGSVDAYPAGPHGVTPAPRHEPWRRTARALRHTRQAPPPGGSGNP
jgi:hypothetical protein